MIKRHSSLTEALADVDAGALTGIRRAIVNRQWWDELSPERQTELHRACLERHIVLFADARVSAHFVELADDTEEPLSSEQSV
ncbi:MAG TPA: hypothetical protein VFS05_15540 [Gemmatimonadaceae bacterium]|nr:hypothetical protein [Gemmatimonadaceae bacterium]